MSWLKQCFGGIQLDFMTAALFVGVVWAIMMLIRIQRATNTLDLADWLRGADGKASWKQAAGIGGFLVGTWAMIYITIKGTVPENYVLLFLVYFAIVIGSPTALQFMSYWRGRPFEQPQNQQIRVDAPPNAQVNVQTGGDQAPTSQTES